MNIRIGPSGNGEEFYSKGYKNTEQMPKWLREEKGLNAYEYSFGRGVNMSKEKAEKIRVEAVKYDVMISGHAPYYVNLANIDDGMLEKSFTYITSTAEMTRLMNGKRIVFHPAGQGKLERDEAVSKTVDNAKRLMDRIFERGYDDMIFCPETLGKIKQIGDTTEVLKICKLWDNFIPCIDFGHLNARTQGGLKTLKDFEDILDEILQTIGERGKNMHVHFSKIMYGTGGEVKHLNFDDDIYGPDYSLLAEAIVKMNFTPTLICESAGRQSEDAKTMSEMIVKLQQI